MDTSDRSVLEECEKLCQKYENLFSRTIDTSDVSRINQANGQPVTVDQETADLIKNRTALWGIYQVGNLISPLLR